MIRRPAPLLWMSLLLLHPTGQAQEPVAGDAAEHWTVLFDGETLAGFTQRNGTADYTVENGAIVGTTKDGSPNSFLCTDELFDDFELTFEVKVDDPLNSGVQIRSQTRGGPRGRVNGPQVEIEASGKNGAEAGYLYGEAAGGWMTPKEQLVPHRHFQDGEWNSYRVLAEGARIRTWINGEPISDLTDEGKLASHPRGFIGLQVHSVGSGAGPYQVRWRNLRIRRLSLRPNIVFIMADDMGYGDVQSQNPRSTVPTPHLDRLAAQGMRFTDAHSGSAVCTPTRYGVLIGRYAWRSRLKRGVLGGYSAPLIEADRTTVASMLREQGYSTAAIGKWHLGMEMVRHDGERPKQDRWDGDGNVDFSQPIAEGPTTRGFDTYFGISASFDMAPYVWIEDDHFTMQPTIQFPGSRFPAFARKGPQAEDVVFADALDVLAAKAAAFIQEQAKSDAPFFLYLPLTGPHKPVVPHARFVGKSKLGPYADFIMNVDDTVGKVLASIDEAGVVENTLVIFTSDNGSFMFRLDAADAPDHVDDGVHQAYRAEHHTANGILRGTKADVWEAGHRVPFLARWPARIKAGERCDETICHTDFFATAAHAAGAPRSPGAGEDSYSALPLMTSSLRGRPRPPVINHSAGGMFAIRDGKWKLIAGNGSGGRQKPRGKPFAEPFQLYDLANDLGETTNVIDAHPEVAARLRALLEEIRGDD